MISKARLIAIVYFFVLFSAFCTTLSSAETKNKNLAQIKSSTLSFALSSSTPEQYELTISQLLEKKSKKRPEAINAKAFSLSNPPRLVIDIAGYGSARGKSVPMKDGHIQALRLGAHPKKTRFVIDLKGDLPAQYNVDNDQTNRVTVSFIFEDSTKTAVPAELRSTLPTDTSHNNDIKEQKVVEPTPATTGMNDQPKISSLLQKPSQKPGSEEKSNNTPAPTFENEIPLDKSPPPLAVVQETPVPSETIKPGAINAPKNTSAEDKKETSTKLEPTHHETASKLSENHVVDNIPKEVTPVFTPPTQIAQLDKKQGSSATPSLETHEALKKAPEIKTNALTPPHIPTEKKAAPQPLSTLESPSGESVVKNLVFRSVENSTAPALMIITERLGSYALVRKTDEMYELVLENIHLQGSHLSLPQFPPDTFRGFEVVVASQRGENVIVKIYVENKTALSPSRNGETLVVRVDTAG